MEENQSTVETISERDCVNCGQPALKGDHPTPLCSDCREQLTRLNIPVWIRLFAGGIAVILLFSLFTLPRTIDIGIHLERGKRAMKEKKYNTAEKELTKVLEKSPLNVEAVGNMLVAAFYNQDNTTFSNQIRKLQQIDPKDIKEELGNALTSTMNRAEEYFSNDSLRQFEAAWQDDEHIPDSAWMNYLRKNSEDRYATIEYANQLLDRKRYHLCDSLVQNALQTDREYIPALMLAASVRREEGDFDGATSFAERVLQINKESIYGLSSKARTLLWQKKDGPALDLALKGYEINDKDLYMLSTLAMAYHFNGRVSDRDAILKRAWKTAGNADDSAIVKYAADVIDNKEKFRD
jgi:Tfp pilus assembly protein PilF